MQSVSSSALCGRRGLVWCEFLTAGATPSNASCGPAWRFKPLHPRSHSSWPLREGSQVAFRQLGSNNRDESLVCGVSCSRLAVSFPRVPSSPSAVALASACRPSLQDDARAEARGAAPLSSRSGGRFSCGRQCPTVRISLSSREHVPDDRGQLSHHRHSSDGRSASAFDLFEPLPQPTVLPQGLVSNLC